MALVMEAHHTATSVAISIACLVVVAALSVPALYQFFIRIRAKKDQYQELPDLYEDEDGEATEESQEAYSDFMPRLMLILISIFACLDALTTAILTTTRPHLSLSLEQWLQFATWVSLGHTCCSAELCSRLPVASSMSGSCYLHHAILPAAVQLGHLLQCVDFVHCRCCRRGEHIIVAVQSPPSPT